MAFNAGTVEGKLELNVKDFVASLKRANVALDKMEEQAKKAAKGTSKFRDALALARDLIIVMPAAFKALSAPLRELLGFFREASNAAADFQKTVAGLETALSLAGVSGVKAFSRELQAFASGLQDVTHHSDGTVLAVAELLTNLGVQKDQLKDATKAVLDYSTATGRNAVEAARQAAKTLGGSLGEMAESLPQLKALTQEQLKAGGAFKFMTQAFGGYSEQFAKTTKGMRMQFQNAWGDLLKEVGGIINPTLDVFTKLGTDIVKRLTEKLRDPATHESFVDTFRNMALRAVEALQGALKGLLNAPAFIAQGGVVIAQLVEKVKLGIAQVRQQFAEFILGVRMQLLDFFANMPNGLAAFLGIDKKDAVAQLVGAVGEAQRKVAEANISLQAARFNGEALVNAAKDNVAEWSAWAQEMEEGSGVVGGINDALEQAETSLKDMSTSANGLRADITAIKQVGDSVATITARMLEHYREINGEVAETKDGTEGVAAATGAAAEKAGTFVNEWGRAVPVLNAAASAMQSVAAAGAQAASSAVQQRSAARDSSDPFGQSLSGQGDAFGRHKGGSAGFDTTSVAGLRQAISASAAASTASVGGLYSRMARKSAHIVGTQLRAKLQGLLEQQMQDFTGGLLDELNRQGVFDPVARQKYITSRIDEAQRLGVLQRPGSGGFFR